MTTLQQRREARRAARDAWIQSGGDGDKAKQIFESDPAMKGLDPATIFALLQIALQLWMWWKQRQEKEPSVVGSSDEPIDLEND